MTIVYLSLILFLLAFLKVIPAYFVAEDWEWFDRVGGLDIFSVYKIFVPVNLGGIEAFFYRPVIPFSFWVNLKLFDLRPEGYHLTNIFLHLLVSLLVYKTALRLFHDRKSAILSFCFFILSPVASQTVSMIDARYDLFVAVFLLGSLLAYLSYLESGGKLKLTLTYMFFILGLLSKEIALIFPLGVTLIVYWRGYLKNQWMSVIFFYILSLAYLLVRVFFVTGEVINQLHLGQLYISRIFMLWIILLIPLMVKRKLFRKDIILSFVLFGVLYLPTAILPTEERYLYLPGVALVWLFSLLLRKIKLTLLITIILVLFASLYILNLRWVKAGEMAFTIITESKKFISPTTTKIYFLGIPDNYKGALIYRTHLATALRYNGVTAQSIFVFGQTARVARNEVKIIDKRSLYLTSNQEFMLFGPAVTGYSESMEPIIEDEENKVIFSGPKSLKINLKQDQINNPQSLFLLFNEGKIVPIY